MTTGPEMTIDGEKLQAPALEQLPPLAFQSNLEAGPIPSLPIEP